MRNFMRLSVLAAAEAQNLSDTITSADFSQQELIATYTECNAFGFPAHITDGIHYMFTANGGVHLESPVGLTVTDGIFGECTITLAAGQWLTGVTYANNNGKLR